MLSGYRTLAATGQILGVPEQRVLDLIERGPLVGRRIGGELKVHDEDLRAFRRPLPLSAASDLGGVLGVRSTSASPAQGESAAGPELLCKLPLLQVATAPLRAVAESPFQSRRGTMGSKAYRALADLPEVQRQGERFLRLVSPEPNTGCHIYLGYIDPGIGYGSFRFNGAVVLPHRFAWVLANNRIIPEKHDIDHICRNRWCVAPPHLEAITHLQNLHRRDAARTHCKRGHALTDENITSDSTHARMCLACLEIRQESQRTRHLRLVTDESAR